MTRARARPRCERGDIGRTAVQLGQLDAQVIRIRDQLAESAAAFEDLKRASAKRALSSADQKEMFRLRRRATELEDELREALARRAVMVAEMDDLISNLSSGLSAE